MPEEFWDSMLWLALYALSVLTKVVWTAASIFINVAAFVLTFKAFENFWFSSSLLIWTLLLSRVGYGFIQYYWEKTLMPEDQKVSS